MIFKFAGAMFRPRAAFGQGTGPILLDDVRCSGNEFGLRNCTYALIDNCAHSEDVGIVCLGKVVLTNTYCSTDIDSMISLSILK